MNKSKAFFYCLLITLILYFIVSALVLYVQYSSAINISDVNILSMLGIVGIASVLLYLPGLILSTSIFKSLSFWKNFLLSGTSGCVIALAICFVLILTVFNTCDSCGQVVVPIFLLSFVNFVGSLVGSLIIRKVIYSAPVSSAAQPANNNV